MELEAKEACACNTFKRLRVLTCKRYTWASGGFAQSLPPALCTVCCQTTTLPHYAQAAAFLSPSHLYKEHHHIRHSFLGQNLAKSHSLAPVVAGRLTGRGCWACTRRSWTPSDQRSAPPCRRAAHLLCDVFGGERRPSSNPFYSGKPSPARCGTHWWGRRFDRLCQSQKPGCGQVVAAQPKGQP